MGPRITSSAGLGGTQSPSLLTGLSILASIVFLPSIAFAGNQTTVIYASRDEIASAVATVCDAELAAFEPRGVYKQQWCEAVFHMGVLAAYELTGNDRYRDAAFEWCRAREWRLGPRPVHADDMSPAQVYLESAEMPGSDASLDAVVSTFDALLADSLRGREVWSWSDALFMAPPAMARLSKATGDPRYVEAMDEMWWDAVDALYAPEWNLLHRDLRQRQWVEASAAAPIPGRPTTLPRFWARGNAWVMAGTVRVLDVLPDDHASRPRYLELLADMSDAVAAVQGEDGLWRPDLLSSRETSLGPDSSASSLFCCAIAWGVAEGVLAQDEFGPVAFAAWEGLENCIDESGRLGWVQRIASSPGAVLASSRADYGAGAFLLAAREIARLAAR